MRSPKDALKAMRPWLVANLRRFTYLVPRPVSLRVKGRAEIFFWKAELDRYARWYEGGPLYGLPSPSPEQRVEGHSRAVNAAITFLELVQCPRYLQALDLDADALAGKRVLDVGCGPFPNLFAFEDCERHGVDPLAERYRAAGYPLDVWESQGFTYHASPAESMPFPDGYFDAVVSVNAIDHVDDITKVAAEIRRVIRPGGLLRMQVNYHRPTVTEPVSLDDVSFRRQFEWLESLCKLGDEPHPTEPGERLTLWGGDQAGPDDGERRDRMVESS